ncbi:alpha/beta fold hydrolase [Paenibacillus alvei]
MSNTGKRMAGWKKGLICGLFLLIILVGSGFVYEMIASKLGEQAFPMPGKLIQIDSGNYLLHVQRVGEGHNGAPTIIMEAGSGESSLSWGNIPAQLSPFAAVVTYDRAGYAWSTRARSERTGEHIVRELHEALDKEGIKGPYIMVGHSLGGLYARLFAQTYREEVVGLVLIDARTEDYMKETASIYAQEHHQEMPSAFLLGLTKNSGVLRLFQDSLLEGMVAKEKRSQFMNVIAKPSYFDAVAEEAKLIDSVENAVRGQKLGDMPVRVIPRGIPHPYSSTGISEEAAKKLEEIWQKGQRRMLNISSNSELIVAAKSGHMVIDDEPQLVVDVIREVLASVK